MIKFKFLLLIGIFIFFNSFDLYAQDYIRNTEKKAEEDESLNSKIFTGGDFGLSLGSVTMINISPLVGYRLDKKTSVGLGAIYLYYSENDPVYNYHANIYGFRIFGRYLIFNNIFAHAEIEEVNFPDLNTVSIKENRIWIDNIYMGGGYRQRIGANSFLNLLVLWNLNDNRYKSYSYDFSNPIIRVTFDIGL
ncbi:MAG: hypothetical protein Q8880_11300 [Bacteroidota bacterium]|nr:hypothetical protein [Bacteroidota bacterium]